MNNEQSKAVHIEFKLQIDKLWTNGSVNTTERHNRCASFEKNWNEQQIKTFVNWKLLCLLFSPCHQTLNSKKFLKGNWNLGKW